MEEISFMLLNTNLSKNV